MLKRSLILLISSLVFLSCGKQGEKLPFIGPKEVIDGDTIYYHAPDYKFTNQDSEGVTNDTYKGKVYAMNFFFSSCPLQCPMITSNLMTVHEELKGIPNFQMVSVTLDPEFDTEEKLTIYADGYEIDTRYWDFLRADENYTYRFMNDGMYQPGGKNPNEPGGIGHSANVVLVDQEGRLRSYYDGRKPEALQQLISDVKLLVND